MAGTDPIEIEVRPGQNLAHLVLKTGGASVKSICRATAGRSVRSVIVGFLPVSQTKKGLKNYFLSPCNFW